MNTPNLNTRLWVTAGAVALALLAGTARTGLAQERYDGKRGRESDDRSRVEQRRFDEHDRQVTRGWYKAHRRRPPMGMRRQDRLPPSLDAGLQVGMVMTPRLQARLYAVPADLLVEFPPPPSGYRYVVIGGRVVLIDPWYRVQDMIWLAPW